MNAFIDEVINFVRQPDDEDRNPWLEWFVRFCAGAGFILTIIACVFAFLANPLF